MEDFSQCDDALKYLVKNSCAMGDDWLRDNNIKSGEEAFEKCPRADWLCWAIVDGFDVRGITGTDIIEFAQIEFGLENSSCSVWVHQCWGSKNEDPAVLAALRDQYRCTVYARIDALNQGGDGNDDD